MHTTMPGAADLLAVLESDAASLEARHAAGDELARLGDPRVMRLDRVAVPAGTLRRLHGEAATENRRVPLEVSVKAFAIDRFPVTVGAFAKFIDVGGYRERAFWSKT